MPSGREEKENRAGWRKDGSGLARIGSDTMDLKSLPHPRLLGQAHFCQPSSDWALKAPASSFLQVLTLLSRGAPSLPCQRRQMQAGMHQKAFWKDWVRRAGSRGHPWERGLGGRRRGVLRAPSVAGSPPSRCTMPRQRPQLLLNLEEEQQGSFRWGFVTIVLKNNLASGKSRQRHVTGRFFVCDYRVPHDAICKYLFWVIFPCPTELFSALPERSQKQPGERQRLRPPQCPHGCAGTRSPRPALKGGNIPSSWGRGAPP